MKGDILRFLALGFLAIAMSGCGPAATPTSSPISVMPTLTLVPPTLTPTQVPPTPTPAPPGWISPQEMAQILASVDIPGFDLGDWMARLGSVMRPVPRIVAGPPPSYAVGNVEDFVFFDHQVGEARTIPAMLRYISEHAYFWFEVAAEVDEAALAQAAGRFESEIYATDRDYFGEEWSPGVDNDPRLSILHASNLGAGSGFFGTNDEYPIELRPDSNQREMFYVNLDYAVVGDNQYLGTLAHEFQHMIQWNNEGNEAHWLDEGLAQVAARLTGFDTLDQDVEFLGQSRTQLNSWTEGRADEGRFYGAAYLYTLYLWERLGDDVLRALARHPGEGLASVNATLVELGIDLNADDLFADWIVANYLDDASVTDGRYGYRLETLGPVCPRQRHVALPVKESRTVPQYAADYVELEGQGAFVIDFKGATEISLISTEPHSGNSFWWSNQGDDADMTLTRAFDLSGVQEATLKFWTWYDIQENADFVYVMVSEDGGETWFILEGEQTTYDFEPGPSYSGVSGRGEEPQWVMEEMDLSPSLGQEILLRFEYITETWFTGDGFAVDDISIPELGYAYDAEAGDDGWEGAGFVRTSNAVPQNWAIQILRLGEEVTVERLEVDPGGSARAEITLDDGISKVVLIVGAMAPVTKVEASYEIEISGELAGEGPPLPIGAGVLFQDDFGDVCSGWGAYSDANVGNDYAEGAYLLEIKVPETLWWAFPGQDFSDVVIDVDTTQETSAVDNSWGVMCRFQDESNSYMFQITNDGLYSVYRLKNGEYVALADWAESGAISRGQGATNHLTVTCDGNLLRLTMNGEVLAEVQDATFSRGDVGLLASTYLQGGARTLFDNLVIRQP